jgi:hypothetical protein
MVLNFDPEFLGVAGQVNHVEDVLAVEPLVIQRLERSLPDTVLAWALHPGAHVPQLGMGGNKRRKSERSERDAVIGHQHHRGDLTRLCIGEISSKDAPRRRAASAMASSTPATASCWLAVRDQRQPNSYFDQGHRLDENPMLTWPWRSRSPHPGVTTALLGARTTKQLDDLLAGVDTVLSDDVLDRIDEIVAPGTDMGTLDEAYVPPPTRRALRRLIDKLAGAKKGWSVTRPAAHLTER